MFGITTERMTAAGAYVASAVTPQRAAIASAVMIGGKFFYDVPKAARKMIPVASFVGGVALAGALLTGSSKAATVAKVAGAAGAVALAAGGARLVRDYVPRVCSAVGEFLDGSF